MRGVPVSALAAYRCLVMTVGAFGGAGSRWRDRIPDGRCRGSPVAGVLPALGRTTVVVRTRWGGLSVSVERVYGDGWLAVLTGQGPPQDMTGALFLGDRDTLIS